MKRPGTITFFVLLLITLGQFAVDIYLPSMPAMVPALNATKSQVQLTLTFFLVGFAASQLVYGPLSERFGRRWVLITGLTIFIASAISASLTDSIETLIWMRLAQGFGIGAANVLCRAILRDLFHDKELAKKIALLGILWVTSPIVAPVIGGYFETHFGWRMNFIFLSVFVGIVWLWTLFCLPETKDPSEIHSIHPKTMGKNYWKLLTSRPFMGYVLADALLYGMFSSFYVAGPFLLQKDLGLSPIAFGWTMLIISAGYLLGTTVNMRLVHHHDQLKMIRAGVIGVIIVSVGLFATATFGVFDLVSFVGFLFLIFFGLAFIFTNCIAKSLAIFPNLAGVASGIWGFFAYLGGALATSVMTLLPEKTQLPLSSAFVLEAVLAALALFWGLHISRHKRT